MQRMQHRRKTLPVWHVTWLQCVIYVLPLHTCWCLYSRSCASRSTPATHPLHHAQWRICRTPMTYVLYTTLPPPRGHKPCTGLPPFLIISSLTLWRTAVTSFGSLCCNGCRDCRREGCIVDVDQIQLWQRARDDLGLSFRRVRSGKKA